MRALMWFTVGFALTCVLGAYAVACSVLMMVAICAFGLAIGLFFVRTELSRFVAVILLGIAVGGGWLWGYDSLYLQPLQKCDGKTMYGTVEVSDYSYETDYGIAADVRLSIEGKIYRARAYIFESDPVKPGDWITGALELRLTTNAGQDGATYHQGQGIFLLIYFDKDAQISPAEEIPGLYFPAKLRRQITDFLDQAMPEDTVAFARALLLGDSSLLTYEEDTAFKISGTRHVIAVSGLHISILFALVLTLSGRRRISTLVLGIPVLILFAAVAGFTPSVVRACIMQGLFILAMFFKREYDPPTALSFAVLVMLLTNPLTVTSVSFQLSVGCLIGIFLFYQLLYDFFVSKVSAAAGKDRKARFVRGVLASVSITLSAMSVTTPLSAIYFGTVSIVGLVANLLILWVVSFVFYGLILTCVLGLFWSAGAGIVAWVISWPIRYILVMAKFLSGSPLSAVYTCSPYVVVWLVLCYVLLILFLLGRRKHPAVLSGCIALGLVLAVGFSWIEPRLHQYQFTVLNVGQGQCLVWQCGDKTYVVDCGGDRAEEAADTAAEYLLSQGIARIDGLILTHYDSDHTGGVIPLLSRIAVDKLYMPNIPEEGVREELEVLFGDRVVIVTDTVNLSDRKGEITLYSSKNERPGNKNGVCVLFQSQECDILITGDRDIAGERELLASADIPDIEILVVGHHGSNSSTGIELLHETRPEVAVISVGADNSYGHPTAGVLKRLKSFGCSIWRTDLDKTITFKG